MTKNQKIIKWIIVILVVVGLTLGIYFTFKQLGLLDPDGVAKILTSSGVVWLYVGYIVLFVFQATLLSMVPGNTALFTAVGLVVFQDIWTYILMTVIGVFLSSLCIFTLGRFAGRKVLYWLFDKEKLDKALELLASKGKKILPIAFLFPIFPDDMICLACGASKIKFSYFTIIAAIFRGIGISVLCSVYFFFGSIGVLIEMIGWPVLLVGLNVIIVDIILILLYYKRVISWFKRVISKKSKKGTEESASSIESTEEEAVKIKEIKTSDV